jgi:hypothetical protein
MRPKDTSMTPPPDDRPITVHHQEPARTGTPVSRRAALQGLTGSLAAALAASGVAGAHPLHEHLAQRSAPRRTAESGAAAPLFLDAHQNATLALVADLVIPGAVASGSPRFIDEVLAVERHDVQRSFVNALGAIDAAARDRFNAAFRDLPRERQTALLEEASTGEPDRVPLRQPFDHLKSWIAGAHYSSEAGLKELGWTGGMIFPAFPGCTHPEGHQ